MRLGEDNSYKVKLKTMLKVSLIIFAISAVIVIAMTFISVYGGGKKVDIDIEKATFTQLDAPKDGQETAIITTNYGEMEVALFREYAPNTVDNFVKKAEAGYYDGTYVFENEPGIYFIGGEKKDVPAEENKIENEITPNLWPFKGSLCSIGNNNSNNGGNNIMFVNSIEFTEDIKKELKTAQNADKLADAFIKNGGIPNFVGQYTVFGQTFKGMDVFEKISGVTSDKKTRRPTEDIIIESIKIINGAGESSQSTEKQ